ncbi:MAG TPA: hypothetical protein VIL16_14685 [Trebonia sp.]
MDDDDILSQGDDREPSPWPRRLGVIAVAVAVVVGGIVYLVQPHSRPAASAAPTPTVSPTPALTPRPVASPEFIRLPAGPNGIVGQTTPWEDSVRLPVSGTQPAWFWPATGRSETIGGLPADSSGYQFTRVGAGWAVQANGSFCGGGDCTTAPSPVWFLANGAQSAIPVGTADLVAPADNTDAMWLTSYFPTANNASASGVAREVSTTGAQIGPSVSVPRGYIVDRATDRGLLLISASKQSGESVYTLWNPASAKATRTFDDVIAASPTEVAWTSRCNPTTCRVDVLDLASGRQTAVGLPSGSSPAGASFSPSGRLLALQLSYSLDGDLAMRLDVATVATGQLTEVPRTSVSSDALFAFGWPVQTDSLVAEFTFMPTIQLASWHLGSSRLAVSVLKPGHTQASLIVG